MSVKSGARSTAMVGRTVILAATAGLAGLAITLVVAVSLLLGAGSGSDRAGSGGATQQQPAYVDYALRHRGELAPVPAPEFVDYALRHRGEP